MNYNPDNETAIEALTVEATRPVAEYTTKVDALLARAAELDLTEQDFADLAIAAADQSGLDVGGVNAVRVLVTFGRSVNP